MWSNSTSTWNETKNSYTRHDWKEVITEDNGWVGRAGTWFPEKKKDSTLEVDFIYSRVTITTCGVKSNIHLKFHPFDISRRRADVFRHHHHHQPHLKIVINFHTTPVGKSLSVTCVAMSWTTTVWMENVNQIHLPIVAKITTKYHQQCGLAFIFASTRFIWNDREENEINWLELYISI